ncbi:hypothetical protein MTO96_029965 [Rhipicephalus appendiculatus]
MRDISQRPGNRCLPTAEVQYVRSALSGGEVRKGEEEPWVTALLPVGDRIRRALTLTPLAVARNPRAPVYTLSTPLKHALLSIVLKEAEELAPPSRSLTCYFL